MPMLLSFKRKQAVQYVRMRPPEGRAWRGGKKMWFRCFAWLRLMLVVPNTSPEGLAHAETNTDGDTDNEEADENLD